MTAVDVIGPGDITDADAVASGYPSAAALVADLRGDPGTRRCTGSASTWPRAPIRATSSPPTAELSEEDRAELDRRLDRLDKASKHGPWTRQVLELIAAHPAVRAGDLAPQAGRDELQDFKLDVRKLKGLGLTISLGVGYRLSPRGEAYLAGRSGG